MSKHQGGPPAGGYGPGKTVLAQPAFVGEPAAPSGPGAIPPTTVRDPEIDQGAAPYVPPYAAPAPYADPTFSPGPPPYANPQAYGAPSPYDASPYGAAVPGFNPPQAYPMTPPPPPARGRRRSQGGPSLAVIGAVSFVIIGGVTTAVAIGSRPSGDDKPIPTVAIPAPTSLPTADPGPVATSDPGADPGPPAQHPPMHRAINPRSRPGRPGRTTPGNFPRPGTTGPNGPMGPYAPRLPPSPSH